MKINTQTARAGSFGTAAAAYDRGRPPYPAEAIDWLLPPQAQRILDLGAGTGKLTVDLHRRGLDVVAVEPSDGMREQLSRVLPDVPALAGTAERIPLDDDSLDAVLVAQAWHWVNTAQALPEVARVLAPGGQLGLLWSNVRDARVDWLVELERIVGGPGSEPSAGAGRVDEVEDGVAAAESFFGLVERHTAEWNYRLTHDMLVDLVVSRSRFITLPEAQQSALLAEVRSLLDTHPALAGTDEIVMPYVTECFRARWEG
ncbi:class I SAM-dependent methyltransferase [Streptomyces stramineus]|uniref:Class I SAM-dependent methyltransferase n=1 Tax=Streptomyces stramineus TaxID=173861 RepID=A0ABN0ZCR8_9ACTN